MVKITLLNDYLVKNYFIRRSFRQIWGILDENIHQFWIKRDRPKLALPTSLVTIKIQITCARALCCLFKNVFNIPPSSLRTLWQFRLVLKRTNWAFLFIQVESSWGVGNLFYVCWIWELAAYSFSFVSSTLPSVCPRYFIALPGAGILHGRAGAHYACKFLNLVMFLPFLFLVASVFFYSLLFVVASAFRHFHASDLFNWATNCLSSGISRVAMFLINEFLCQYY